MVLSRCSTPTGFVSGSSDGIGSVNGRVSNQRTWFRNVTQFDGQSLVVGGVPCYELGNYLGGGVAGVVYEGENLRWGEDNNIGVCGQGDIGTDGDCNHYR